MGDRPLGRREPTDWAHVERYPALALFSARRLEGAPPGTEKNLGLPWWWREHDQGMEGACVGFGSSAMMSVTNHRQRFLATGRRLTYRYDCRWLYQQAQLVDEWDETPPEEGTSVRASGDILRNLGHRRVQPGGTSEPLAVHGIQAVRWATTVDEMRGALWSDLAVSIGVLWYSSFDDPQVVGGERWIGRQQDLGWVRGGHCVCVYGYSDRREAFRLMNSWGEEYPPVWLTYPAMQRLLDEYGEAALITDQ